MVLVKGSLIINIYILIDSFWGYISHAEVQILPNGQISGSRVVNHELSFSTHGLLLLLNQPYRSPYLTYFWQQGWTFNTFSLATSWLKDYVCKKKFMIKDSFARNIFSWSNKDVFMVYVTSEWGNEYVLNVHNWGLLGQKEFKNCKYCCLAGGQIWTVCLTYHRESMTIYRKFMMKDCWARNNCIR